MFVKSVFAKRYCQSVTLTLAGADEEVAIWSDSTKG